MSNIRPDTTHVMLNFSQVEAQYDDIETWLCHNSLTEGRVEVYAYQGDDPIDHQLLWSFQHGVVLHPLFSASPNTILI